MDQALCRGCPSSPRRGEVVHILLIEQKCPSQTVETIRGRQVAG